VADLTAGAGVVRKRLADHSELIGALADGALPEVIAELAERVVEVLRAGGKVLLFGNGGSNADASHLAAEFVGRLHRERIALPALSLGDQHAAITAIGNDLGFEEIFARGIDAFGDAGDIAIALTTSGRSRNVLRGLEAARARGLYCVVFTGEGNADIDAHVVVRIPSGDTQQIQEATMHLGHTLCGLVEDTLPSPRPA
jgi:D-sedoheptulose 7-phosphate isomerase